jgi:hypothetical protein
VINLKVSTLVMCLIIAAGISAAGTSLFFNMRNTASADATAVLNCKQPPDRSAETFRHAEPVNTGRNKEY